MADSASRTLYRKVADDLRAQIASGSLPVGKTIPSTPDLEEIYGVSATAIRNAVRLLVSEGLLEGEQGKGVFVVATPDEAAQRKLSLQGVQSEVDGLRSEVKQLAGERQTEVAEKVEELQAAVGQLQADLRTLYDRLGQPYPHGQNDSKPKRRTSGA